MQAGTPEPVILQQLHLGMFTAHEISAWEHWQRRLDLRRAQRPSRPAPRARALEDGRTAYLFDLPDLVLQHPLGGLPAGNELNTETDPLQTVDMLVVTDESAEQPVQAWSDEAVAQLHEAVLHYSLRALQARGNAAEKREVLQWIFAPQPRAVLVRDARGVLTEAALPQVHIPFSFERCCRICGYSPERVEEELLPILVETGLGNVLNEITNGRKQHHH
jgi:hypothetical protein